MQNEHTRRRVLRTGAAIAIGSVSAGVASADHDGDAITVGDGEDFETIQDAVDHAGSGDTIEVLAGTYEEAVELNQSVELVGVGDVVISPETGRPLSIQAHIEGRIPDITIDNFRLAPQDNSHALLAVSGTVTESPDVTGLTLDNVRVDGTARGIGLNSVRDVSLRNLQLSGVSGGGEGALELTGASDLVVQSSTFENNEIAIRLQDTEGLPGQPRAYGENGPVVVRDSSFTGNGVAIVNGDDDITEDEFDAERNWWGHPSGPSGEGGRRNPAGREVGRGDDIEGDVDFDPWLRRPVDT